MIRVIGIEKNVVINFVDRQGQRVNSEGLRLYLGCTRRGVDGLVPLPGKNPLFVNKNREYFAECEKLVVGDTVEVTKDYFDNVVAINKVEGGN